MSNTAPSGSSSAIGRSAPSSSACGANAPRNASASAMQVCASCNEPGAASAFHPARRSASSDSGSASPRRR
ncbi:hypothetical protein WS76_10015 [Burkholderia humptydooensis]|nr:hypothetical protein WS76_10015 [Burkholderia humptydooensis]